MRMKFLLVAINSKYIHSNPAVYSLKAYAGKNSLKAGTVIEIQEYTINQMPSDILGSIYGEKPDYIGFSCYIWNRKFVDFLLPEIGKILPHTKVFLGGPEVSYHPEDELDRYENVSAVMVGEGEATFSNLLSVLPDDYKDWDERVLYDVPGLYTREGYTAERKALDMDELPFFYDFEGTDVSFENRIIYYEASRGCPYRCSYCLSSIEKSLRLRSTENVKKHLRFFLDKKVKQVKFVDRTFNANHDFALEIWKFINENDNGVTNFHFEIAADILTEDEISVLGTMRAGLVQLEIGVQSTNEQTLRAINRFARTDVIEKNVDKLLKPQNVHVHLDLIAGLPYEDMVSFKKSFNDVFSMKPHQLQLGFLKVLKGTLMEMSQDAFEIACTEQPPYEVLSTKWLSYDDVLKLKDVEKVLEDYYNSAQFTYTLPVIMEEFESPFDFFEALADYYKDNGYFVMTPARSRKYEILLEFCEHIKGSLYTEKMRDLLTLDYYVREKPKSKPSFVKNVPSEGLIDYTKRSPITYNFVANKSSV